jgi:NADP-dependent 3-hydroxy acid dehydrogenase YdfG
MKKLESKIVFNTGKNSGIGKASALNFAAKGATVVIAELENNIYRQSIDEMMDLWVKCHFVAIDLLNVSRVKQALNTTVEKIWRIDFPIKNYLKIGSAFLLIVLSLIGFMALYFHAIYK